MPDALILAAARTPIGRARKGSLTSVDAYQLAEVAVSAAVDRSQIPIADLDDLFIAESLQGGGVIARNIAVRLGMTGVPGVAINRHCASGATAVQLAAATIIAGMADVIAAGGTESASTMPRLSKMAPGAQEPTRWSPQSHPDAPGVPPFDMSVTIGENTARLHHVTREQADAWSARSQQRALNAIAKGYFDDEIVGVPVTAGTFSTDEHPRDTTPEALAGLKVLHPEIPDAVVTAGNSAGINDAAAALVIGGSDFAASHGLTPLARIRGWASVGVDVQHTGMAPVTAIPQALKRSGLTLDDVDLFEINEAFATMAVACTRDLGLDESIVNVNGSGISLGHPIAATGARMVVSIIHELVRRDARIGVVAMCAGGGMGSALVVERI
ncbi:thiolase family protein [Mycobacterium sp. AZCC_0083]|uniref:thiolase family protein n=1 Tax=Mycobacterium sp. AZCC_0083 TaxID=2735882 RepID=UPI00160DEDFE|nr:thiolase family protein [Mycobacterium sp. AZCC_0083]MBB5167348.1 acetyl-CoA C-acetyltransferase [Mycobacterium sp. AZCC_0083]